jgi:hypothetical protein
VCGLCWNDLGPTTEARVPPKWVTQGRELHTMESPSELAPAIQPLPPPAESVPKEGPGGSLAHMLK